MEYVLETKFEKSVEGIVRSIKEVVAFNTDHPPDSTHPALIFIHTNGIGYTRNRVSFNGNFLWYLRATSQVTILQVDNRWLTGEKKRGRREQ
ncbi:MAG: hypothetical protein GY940_21550 [bacterium]|nr:hypothetical protein [bacterium]